MSANAKPTLGPLSLAQAEVRAAITALTEDPKLAALCRRPSAVNPHEMLATADAYLTRAMSERDALAEALAKALLAIEDLTGGDLPHMDAAYAEGEAALRAAGWTQ